MNTKPDALKLARVPIVDRGIGWQADATQTLREQAVEIQQLRQLLAVRVAGALLYADDGELQDNTQHPCIDFRRDAPSGAVFRNSSIRSPHIGLSPRAVSVASSSRRKFLGLRPWSRMTSW